MTAGSSWNWLDSAKVWPHRWFHGNSTPGRSLRDSRCTHHNGASGAAGEKASLLSAFLREFARPRLHHETLEDCFERLFARVAAKNKSSLRACTLASPKHGPPRLVSENVLPTVVVKTRVG